MWNVNTTLPINYDIVKIDDAFNINNDTISKYCINKKSLIVIDKEVTYCLDKIEKYFNFFQIEYCLFFLEGGENNKSLDNTINLLQKMENFGISRKDEPVIGIGGGVVLDIVGLASNLYRRGVPYIKVPTTLLGIVDVSVAAKTGINFEERRNRLGSYYPATLTIIDKTFISTLNEIEISSGMGEILKIAVIKNKKLFNLLEQYGEELLNSKFKHNVSDEVIDDSITDMIEELKDNLFEKVLKRCVDFGHTFSPIIEMRSINTTESLTHGQAVTLDVIFSSIISFNRNLLIEKDLIRIIDTAKKMKLPIFHNSFTDPLLLLESLNDMTKHRNGDQNLPIPVNIGEYIFINDLTYSEICKCVEIYKKYTNI
jgi:3-dehydroquinate synthetase